MKFSFLDKILEVHDGKKLVGSRCLTLSEEYFQDHFPGFPVMPGVLMLEALVQAASWLLRIAQKFSFSSIILSEVKNVRYGQFVRPGDILRTEVTLEKVEGNRAHFRGRGYVGERSVVSSHFALKYFNLASIDPVYAPCDQMMAERYREQYLILNHVQPHAS